MLNRIHVKNFKSFRERTTLDFRPITLLYGRNSSGKSSVFHLLRYLEQIFTKRDADPSSLGIGDLASVIHGQTHAEKTIDVQIDGTWNVYAIYPGEVTDRFGRVIYEQNQGVDPVFDEPNSGDVCFREVLDNRVDDLRLGDTDATPIEFSVKLSIHQNDFPDEPEVCRYELILESEHFMTVWTESDDNGSIDCDLNLNHGFFDCDDPSDTPTFGRSPDHDFNLLKFWFGNTSPKELPIRGSCLPSAQRPYEFSVFLCQPIDVAYRVIGRVQFWVNYLMYGSFIQVQRELQKIVHLGPLRHVPELSGLVRNESQSTSWYDGSAAWESLKRMPDDDFKHAAAWLAESDKLNLEYGLHRQHLQLQPVDSSTEEDDVSESLAGERFVDLWLSSETARRLKPAQVGVGVSQVMPILAAVFDECDDQWMIEGQCKRLLIEQPELHLHPEAQAALADLFIKATRRKNCIVLVETHSEPLLLRLLRRIKESCENSDSCPYPFDMSELSVQHFSIEDGATKINRIAVADDGTLADDWPDDLLSLAFNETFGR